METLKYPFLSRLFTTSLLLLVLDLPWLLFMSNSWQQTIRTIQSGESPYFRTWAAIPVYIALAFLLLQATSREQAALMGLATYAVFDFTNITIFKQYPISIGFLDTLWGGVLFFLAYSILSGVN
jgi:uncharacterized membrane protein